jgi:hypothetical protein
MSIPAKAWPRQFDGSFEPITKAGVYNLPIDAYHGNCCDGPSISSTGLRRIEAESPLHYWFESPLNPNAEKPEGRAAFDFGRAAHCLLLGEPVFRRSFAVRPDKWSDWRTSDAREWKKERESAGLTVIAPDDLETIKAMAKAVDADAFAGKLIRAGDGIERSLIWKDDATGIWLKSRPDIIISGMPAVVDLKTTVDASDKSLERTMADFGYHMQAGLAAEGMRRVLNTDIGNEGAILIFVEKYAPYAVNVKVIDPEALHHGWSLCRRALRTFKACWDDKRWPGYRGNGGTLSLPAWETKRLREEVEAGLLEV